MWVTRFGDTFLLPGDATASWTTIDWERLPEDQLETPDPGSNHPPCPNQQILGSSPIAARQARPPYPPSTPRQGGGSELPGCPLPALCRLSIA